MYTLRNKNPLLKSVNDNSETGGNEPKAESAATLDLFLMKCSRASVTIPR